MQVLDATSQSSDCTSLQAESLEPPTPTVQSSPAADSPNFDNGIYFSQSTAELLPNLFEYYNFDYRLNLKAKELEPSLNNSAALPTRSKEIRDEIANAEGIIILLLRSS